MFAWILSLFGLRSRRAEGAPIDEEAAYIHSYGDRTGEVISVEPLPEPEPESGRRIRGDLTGEFLRRAFERKLEARKKLSERV
jgi:hypothetical protein